MGMVRLGWGWTFPILVILWFFIPSHDPDLVGEMLVGFVRGSNQCWLPAMAQSCDGRAEPYRQTILKPQDVPPSHITYPLQTDLQVLHAPSISSCTGPALQTVREECTAACSQRSPIPAWDDCTPYPGLENTHTNSPSPSQSHQPSAWRQTQQGAMATKLHMSQMHWTSCSQAQSQENATE